MGVWVTVVLIGAIALPSLARKKKVQPGNQQQQTVRVDLLSPNNRKRYDYFLTEAARQHAAGNYSAAFDLYEHARNIDPNSATANYYLSLYLTEMKQDSLGLLRLQKAIEQDPENLILQSDSPNTISARENTRMPSMPTRLSMPRITAIRMCSACWRSSISSRRTSR